jgi:hypothetical protein
LKASNHYDYGASSDISPFLAAMGCNVTRGAACDQHGQMSISMLLREKRSLNMVILHVLASP